MPLRIALNLVTKIWCDL